MVRVWIAAFAILAAGSAAAQDFRAEVEDARRVIQELRGVMMEHLQQAMADVGPAGATDICRHLAPEIAAELTERTGWEIRRPAQRVRNPDNRPTDEERGVLLSYAARAGAGQDMSLMETTRIIERDGEPYVQYMRAIPTFEPCLVCHGDTLAPDVAAAIRQSYPDDRAVGFAAGDLRGAFSLIRPYRPERTRVVEPPAPPIDLPQEVALGIAGRFGNAAAGQSVYRDRCEQCHAPSRLAAHVFEPSGEPIKADLCLFLETHGLVDAARDCDIVAYLKVLAQHRAD